MFKKKVTVGLIEKYLDRYGWEHHEAHAEPGEKEGVVVTGWRSALGEGSYMLVIDPIVEKNVLIFRVSGIAEAPPSTTAADKLNGMLLAMGAINYRLMLGGWAYDPSDGEIVYRCGIPIDDDDFSYEAFEHCLRAVALSVETDAPHLRKVLEGEETAQEVVEAQNLTVG